MLGLLGAAGGGGMSASGEISTKLAAGGTSTATFGAINFGSGSAGGATSGGTGNNMPLYVLIGAVALVFLFKR